MSSDSPSGGMKEIVRSLSKRERRTHWWNFTSSITTVFPLSPERNTNAGISAGRGGDGQRARGRRGEHGTLTSRQGEEHPVVEAEPQFGHPGEHGLQLDAAHDVTAHHAAVSVHLTATRR